MRRTLYHTIIAISLMMPLLFSCGNKDGRQSEVTEAEERERDKTGNVYNSEEQGVDIENRDNQFNSSRNDNTEGYGQETGAPSDTIDNDGDRKVNNTKKQ